jgi:hypothetical protein
VFSGVVGHGLIEAVDDLLELQDARIFSRGDFDVERCTVLQNLESIR